MTIRAVVTQVSEGIVLIREFEQVPDVTIVRFASLSVFGPDEKLDAVVEAMRAEGQRPIHDAASRLAVSEEVRQLVYTDGPGVSKARALINMSLAHKRGDADKSMV